jgi:hypothetical protein
MPAENFEIEARTQTADDSQNLFSDFWTGFKKGGVDELEYNKNHSDAAMIASWYCRWCRLYHRRQREHE